MVHLLHRLYGVDAPGVGRFSMFHMLQQIEFVAGHISSSRFNAAISPYRINAVE